MFRHVIGKGLTPDSTSADDNKYFYTVNKAESVINKILVLTHFVQQISLSIPVTTLSILDHSSASRKSYKSERSLRSVTAEGETLSEI